METKVKEAIEYGKKFIKEGNVATYIPELGKVDPNQLGVTIVDTKGNQYSFGDSEKKFTIQSVSKPTALMLALMERGEEYVFKKVGMEPTGDAFNSIIKLETIRPSKPLNPLINAGAIAIDSMLFENNIQESFSRLIEFFRVLTANNSLWYNEKVYESEKSTGYRNRALAHFMKDSKVLEGDVEEVLDLYFRQCSIEVNCMDIARIGAIIAMDGVDPNTGEKLVPKRIARIVKTFMVTCGMYDASGEFAIKVGIPAKSGVGGGIMAAVPGRMGIGVFGPALDCKGNSVGGVKVLEYLSRELNLSIF